MNKFQKLSQLNKDIELLENAGKIKAADILHKKFIKEAQYAMPLTYNPMMFNPMMFNPMAYNPMMARTVVNPTGAVSQPSVVPKPVVNPGPTPAPMPVAQSRTKPVQIIGTTPTVNPPTTLTTPKAQPSPGNTQIVPSPPTVPYDKYKNFYYDQKTGKDVFIDPGTHQPFENQNDIPKEIPAPVQPPTNGNPPPARQITPPNDRQKQLGGFLDGKIDKFFGKNPPPSIDDQYTFIGNLEDQLKQYRDSGNLTQQQYLDLTNELYVR